MNEIELPENSENQPQNYQAFLSFGELKTKVTSMFIDWKYNELSVKIEKDSIAIFKGKN